MTDATSALSPPTVIIADDDRTIRAVLHQALARQGYEVQAAGTVAALWHLLDSGEGDILITDVMFPDGDALDVLPRIRQSRPNMPVIVMSARNTLLTAVKATERGAFEYFPKPFDLPEVTAAVERALAGLESGSDNDGQSSLPDDADGEAGLPLIGRSPAMQNVYRVIARLTATDLTAMIIGESGTGKELVARALHRFSKRKHGPFVALNMAAIPRELVESELFGHEKGAFTGAVQRKAGRFEQARGGTLFLDEIGDMPIEAQTRLLRVLQEGEFTTVGGREPVSADVRIIAATHRNLRQLVNQGLFREDLFYRLNVVPIRLPPLRERREDISLLMRHFLTKAAEEAGLPPKTLNPDALARLGAYRWPGNVRELENLARRLVALYADETIDGAAIDAELAETAEDPPRAQPGNGGPSANSKAEADGGLSFAVEKHLCDYFAAHGDDLPPPGLYGRILKEIERPLLSVALAATRGNQIKAAGLLGLNRNTLRKKLKDHDIEAVRTTGQGSSGRT